MSEGKGPAQWRPAWAGVDLDALVRNFERIRRRVQGRILGVVKADAYGHGAIEVARTLEEAGIDWLGVAFLGEGRRLRQAGISVPILVMMPLAPPERAEVRRLGLTPVVSSLEQLALWCEDAEEVEPPLTVHLKVDTGMARLGLAPDELEEALRRLERAPRLRLGGLVSHFRESERPLGEATERQEARFDELAERLRDRLPAEEQPHCLLHIANSAAALHRRSSHYSLVRIGGALYGVDLVTSADPELASELEGVMSVTSSIVQTRQVATGRAAGYGGRWVARRPSRLAVVPVGYADGYSTRLEAGSALLGGRRVPLAGAISMDMLVLDVTDVEAAVGDPVVLLGRQGGERISVDELASREGVVAYEILCRFGMRLEKRYGRAAPAGTRFR